LAVFYSIHQVKNGHLLTLEAIALVASPLIFFENIFLFVVSVLLNAKQRLLDTNVVCWILTSSAGY